MTYEFPDPPEIGSDSDNNKDTPLPSRNPHPPRPEEWFKVGKEKEETAETPLSVDGDKNVPGPDDKED